MSRVLLLRIVLLVVGLLVWGWGYRYDDADVRLVAIGILVVAVLLRFAQKRRQAPLDE